MRLLFVVQRFHQGWGGAPESVRLTARRLAGHGVVCDVVDRGRLYADVAGLTVLPTEDAATPPFVQATVPDYAAVAIVGPWQDYRKVGTVLAAMRPDQPLLYLPRGGLADIEFRPGKWLKKMTYLRLLESRLLRRADHIVFSSELERTASTRIAALTAKGVVVPDHFHALPADDRGRPLADTTVIGFMAEIGMRKGLLPFLHGLIDWHANSRAGQPVVMRVAGAARPDAAAYLGEARALAEQAGNGLAIEFVGPVAHDARAAFYANCDLFAVPSLFESFCLTALEALGSGCPVLASPRLGVLEQLPADPAVTVMRDWSPAAIGDALEKALPGPPASEVQKYASDAIECANRLADQRWLALLDSGRS